MTIEQARFFQRVSEDQGNQECEIREDYSGRCMYGQTTAGVVVASVLQLLIDVVNYVEDNVSEFCDDNVELEEYSGATIPHMNGLRQDNMGRDTILY